MEIPRQNSAAGQDVATLSVDQALENLTSAINKHMENSLEMAAVADKVNSIGENAVSLMDQLEADTRQVQELETKNGALELWDARKALIEGFLKKKLSGKDSSVIGIKIMGELDEKPFLDAFRRKYGDVPRDSMFLSSWRDEVNSPSWHPFKILEVDGKTQEVVDESDAKLMQLHTEHGDEVCNAVKVAVAELREYNPGGRRPVPELWNFGEGRKATIAEAVNCILEQLEKK